LPSPSQNLAPFAFAGIWDAWKRPDGTYLETFAIVTTEPNELVAQIHDRLALLLHPQDYDRWLGIDDRGGDTRPPLDLLPYVGGFGQYVAADDPASVGSTDMPGSICNWLC
jgi:hypothetical protein